MATFQPNREPVLRRVRELVRVVPPAPVRVAERPAPTPVVRTYRGDELGAAPDWFVTLLDRELRALGWEGSDDDGTLAASVAVALARMIQEMSPAQFAQLRGGRAALPAGGSR